MALLASSWSCSLRAPSPSGRPSPDARALPETAAPGLGGRRASPLALGMGRSARLAPDRLRPARRPSPAARKGTRTRQAPRQAIPAAAWWKAEGAGTEGTRTATALHRDSDDKCACATRDPRTTAPRIPLRPSASLGTVYCLSTLRAI